MTAGAPLATLCETADAWYALGTEVVAEAGALFVHDRRCPDVYDANHARCVAGVSDPPAFLAALEERYGSCGHRAVRLDPRSPGDALEAELLLRGFACELLVLMARRRGVATALVAHSALDAQRRGAATCFLAARADDTPKEMYARMGFRAVGVARNLLKTGVAGDPAARR